MAGLNYNELIITFPDGDEQDITEDNIVSESMRLTQSICDEDYLKFGGCIASEFRIDLLNTNERSFTQKLAGRWISVKLIQHTISGRSIYPSSSLYPSSDLFPGYERVETVHYIFSGFIESAKLSENNMNVRTVIAYDALAKLYEADTTNELYRLLCDRDIYINISSELNRCLSGNGMIAIPLFNGDEWFAAILNDTCDLDGNGRTSPTEYVKNYLIVNNDWKNSDRKISYAALLKFLCEVVAAFGVIMPDSSKGSFKMVTFSGTPKVYDFYEKLQCEEYVSTGYTDFKFSVYGEDKDGKSAHAIGGLSNMNPDSVEKCYDFTDNITIWQEFAKSGNSRTTTMFDRLINSNDSSIGYRLAMNPENGDCAFDSYRPLKATVEGTPEQIVGSPIIIIVNKTNPDGSYQLDGNGNIVKENINTYVFKRTLTGIQALTDEIEVKGQR